MVGIFEHERTHLENDGKSREQIGILIDVDRGFRRYELEFSTENASAAAGAIGRLDIVAFVDQANTFLRHARTGRPLHSIRLGCQFGSRTVTFDFFKGIFPDSDKWIGELEMMAMANGAIRCGNEESQNGIEIWARWDR